MASSEGKIMKKSSSVPTDSLDALQHFFNDPKLKQRARDEFLANVNHDLRTPLNAVIGFAQIIENEMFGKVHPQYLEYARHIQESGYDLLSKIEDLMDPPLLEDKTAKTSIEPVRRKNKKLAAAQ
mgnify:CR=1 FL=1